MDNKNNIRVAWLFPSIELGNYWHPVLSKFTDFFPDTIIYTGKWPGFTKGYEGKFNVEVVGNIKRIETSKSSLGYDFGFDLLSPAIISRLFQFRPQIIFTLAFSLWSLLAVLLKPIFGWQVIIAYEGSSPNVDYCNSKFRITWRQIITRFTDAFITNTNRGKYYLIDVLKADKNLVFHQPYEVPDIQALSAQKVDVDSIQIKLHKHPVFLFVGQVISRKGIDLLLEACVFLQKQNYCDYTLLIIGDGIQRNELEEFTQKHELQNCVKWLGWLDYSVLSYYFQMVDVFVFPTLEDTWGMVVLEAMTFGKPILCSQFAGASEMVIHGKNGYIFDPYQTEDLAKFMKEFIDNPSVSIEMGNQSKELISQHTPETSAIFFNEVISILKK